MTFGGSSSWKSVGWKGVDIVPPSKAGSHFQIMHTSDIGHKNISVFADIYIYNVNIFHRTQKYLLISIITLIHIISQWYLFYSKNSDKYLEKHKLLFSFFSNSFFFQYPSYILKSYHTIAYFCTNILIIALLCINILFIAYFCINILFIAYFLYQYLVYRIFLYAWDLRWSRTAINKIVAVSVIQPDKHHHCPGKNIPNKYANVFPEYFILLFPPPTFGDFF